MSSKKDEAVSPVIATILLVAIVVVLVALVAAVVLPMVGNIETTKSVGVSVKLNETGQLPVVTIISGQDAGSLTNLTVYVTGASKDPVITSNGTPIVGKPYSAKDTAITISKGKQIVSVVGTFNDGTNQTLYTTTMTFTGS